MANGRRWTHGPSFEGGGTVFRLWAPGEARVGLVLDGRPDPVPMERGPDGFFETFVAGAEAGLRYRFELADGTRVADPASRFQPDDVHGASETVDLFGYPWSEAWAGVRWEDVVLYELHLGAFTRAGTFDGAAEMLDYLAALGVNAVEIMPVADFPGARGWGYDGVFLYAPDASYGRPERFQAFVEAAHGRGVAVILDVVFNHFGPDGNVLPRTAPGFFTARHETPWGAAINYDGPESRPVRDFVIENAEYWLEAFHLDGLRLDAVHAIRDDSRPDILAELAERVRSRFDRPIHLILENELNEPERLAREEGRAARYDAQWNDDVHHALRVAATGEQSGYYADYGETRLLARALAEGFAYQGQPSAFRGGRRGAPSAALPPVAFVAFDQNHDQIGNRAFGERLTALASPAAVRAVASVVLLLPQIPMLFMGEEWGAEEPFLFFCDFSGDLAEAVGRGRRQEFARFPEFSDPERVASIPDPLAEATFLASKLDWSRIDAERLAFTRAAITARRAHVAPLLAGIQRGGEAIEIGDQAVRVRWTADGASLILDANLKDRPQGFPAASGRVVWRAGDAGDAGDLGPWSVRWSVVGP